jgi:hypothetical protein
MSDLKSEILSHHTFTFPSLRPGSGSHQQPYLRFLMFIKKRPDISDEKFHAWWKTVHADLAVAVEGFGGHCMRYVQMHQTAEHRREAEKYGLPVLEYDGVGEMHVKSLEDWLEFQKSEAFAGKLVGECCACDFEYAMVLLTECRRWAELHGWDTEGYGGIRQSHIR